MSNATSSYTFVDLFAGCGGLSLGLMQAGWTGLFAVERDPMAFRTLSENFLSEAAQLRRMRLQWPNYLPRGPLSVEDLLHGAWAEKVLALRGRLDMISGGPPCQGFSFSGRRQRNDPRNRMVEAYAEVVVKLRPTLLLIENVPGILVPHGKRRRQAENPSGVGRPPRSYAEKLASLLADDYHFVRDTVNAADFGVPQNRKRFFGVGILRRAVDPATIVHGNRICRIHNSLITEAPELDPFLVLRELRKKFLSSKGLSGTAPVTVGEAIGDITSSRNEVTRSCCDPDSPAGFLEVPYQPPGESQQTPFVQLMRAGLNGQVPDSLRLARHSSAITRRFRTILDNCPRGVRLNEDHRSRYSTLKHRIVPLHRDQVGHTITTLPDDILHYSEPRILTVRECARLQSFPDWFVFQGKFTTGGDRRTKECPRYTQVGNAVPPLLAEAWGFALRRVLGAIIAERTGSRPAQNGGLGSKGNLA